MKGVTLKYSCVHGTTGKVGTNTSSNSDWTPRVKPSPPKLIENPTDSDEFQHGIKADSICLYGPNLEDSDLLAP